MQKRWEQTSAREKRENTRKYLSVFALFVLFAGYHLSLALECTQSYFRHMKRIVCLSAICLLSAAPMLKAQDSGPTPLPSSSGNSAAAIAAKQEAAENYNTLKGTVDDMVAAQADMQKKIHSLAKDIADLRADASKPKGNYASDEDLKALAKAVEEIDKKRQADKEEILKAMEKLGKLVAGAPPVNSSPDTAASHEPGHKHNKHNNESSGDEPEAAALRNGPGFNYEVKKGDTLSLIAQAYREQGIKVSTPQIIKANPNINPAKLLVGTKIFIPAPKGSVPDGK